MPATAVMFGSIGTLMETSDIQRRAYNQALAEAGLTWVWDRETYADLLDQSGGKDRLTLLSEATAAGLSHARIDGIHARKTELACAEIVRTPVALRPGVAELVDFAKANGLQLAFVTTTYQANIDAIFAAAGAALRPRWFDYIGSREAVTHGKPAPDAYHAALGALGVTADRALAVEDTALSVMSAKRAGLTVVATPGAITEGQDFWQADMVIPSLLSGAGLDHRLIARLER